MNLHLVFNVYFTFINSWNLSRELKFEAAWSLTCVQEILLIFYVVWWKSTFCDCTFLCPYKRHFNLILLANPCQLLILHNLSDRLLSNSINLILDDLPGSHILNFQQSSIIRLHFRCECQINNALLFGFDYCIF